MVSVMGSVKVVAVVLLVVLVTNVKCLGAGEKVFIKAQKPAALL